MRVLLLLLILAIMAQPLQAGRCEMESDRPMQLKQIIDKGSSHDCCKQVKDHGSDECDLMLQCAGSGSCSQTCPDDSDEPIPRPRVFDLSFLDAELRPSHSSPPYPPPIA